jgi:CheY-like chemotaxis protein
MVNDVVRIDALALDAAHELTLSDTLCAGAKNPIIVTGCYSSLSHCLLNLVKNAREAMPRGGKVDILWEGDEKSARLTVRDNGMGISKEDLSRIFEPFYSTKKSGTGLGLAMVKGIVSQHEGTVEIASEKNVGTSVTLVWPRKITLLKALPRTFPNALPATSAESRKTTDEIMKANPALMPTTTTGKNKLAFVIDDDELVRGGVQGLLEHIGYKVEGFDRGESAIAALAPSRIPRLILVDYHMPGMDGSEFIRYWFSELPQQFRETDTQILLVSGHPPSQFQEIIRKYSEQNVGLLQKPFSMETLQRKLVDFSAVRSITTRIRPNTNNARPVPIGNPSMRQAVIKTSTPLFRPTFSERPVPKPRIAGNPSTKIINSELPPPHGGNPKTS